MPSPPMGTRVRPRWLPAWGCATRPSRVWARCCWPSSTTEGRWTRAGEVAHRVEPDLKNGRGGLRDIQLLDALAAAQLVDRPTVDVQDARRLMIDLRVELHRRAGRARDVMQAQDAHEVVAAVGGELGVSDRYELARALSGAARTVVFATDTALRSARAALPKRGLAALRRAPASAVTAILTLGAPITAALQLVANGQVPGPMALAGHGAVLAAGVVIAWLALRPASATTRTSAA